MPISGKNVTCRVKHAIRIVEQGHFPTVIGEITGKTREEIEKMLDRDSVIEVRLTEK